MICLENLEKYKSELGKYISNTFLTKPKPNEIWKHFKGNLYKIIAVGHHSETKDKLVVYFDLSSKNSTVDDPCIRPLDMFMSEVDRDKYPDVKQKYRFELAQTVLNFQK